jgi:site-specific DNA recombinase
MMPRAAIYCRLSDEDRDKTSPEQYSESIQNQKNLLTMYCIEKSWDIYKIYCDDDFSGADEDRPDYNLLLMDAEKGCFDIVLCKTQSRFTRDLAHLEKYVHTYFKEWGIRFIGVIDNADTEIRGNKKSRQINGLVNEWYLEDLSENVKAVLLSKKKLGKFVGAFPPYGYQRDPKDKNHLIMDPDAAEIVKRIFKMYLTGYSLRRTAKILNDEGIPCPVKYKQDIQGTNFKIDSTRVGSKRIWTDSSMHMILNNQMYAGDMVQNKSEKISYKRKTIKRLNKDQWIIVKNTHEPIIDRDAFERVAELAGKKIRPDRNGKTSKFAGKLRCALCGCNLVKHTYRDRIYYHCGFASRHRDYCQGCSITEKMLEDSIILELNENIKKYINTDVISAMIQVEKENEAEERSLEKRLKDQQKEMKAKENAITSLYLDKVKGIISEEQFVIMNQIFLNERESLVPKISALEEKLFEIHASKNNMLHALDEEKAKREAIAQYLEINELTREIIIELVDFIVIENLGIRNSKRIEIHWKF